MKLGWPRCMEHFHVRTARRTTRATTRATHVQHTCNTRVELALRFALERHLHHVQCFHDNYIVSKVTMSSRVQTTDKPEYLLCRQPAKVLSCVFVCIVHPIPIYTPIYSTILNTHPMFTHGSSQTTSTHVHTTHTTYTVPTYMECSTTHTT